MVQQGDTGSFILEVESMMTLNSRRREAVERVLESMIRGYCRTLERWITNLSWMEFTIAKGGLPLDVSL